MQIIKKYIVNIVYSLKYRFSKIPKVYSIDKTLDFIIRNKCSVARYGDGEIKWIYGIEHPSFQKPNLEMDEKLKNILKNANKDNKNIIICIPEFFNGVNQFDDDAKYYYKKNFIIDGKLWRNLLSNDHIYYNSDITRPYIDYKSKSRSKEYFKKWKKIFENRNLLLVEGQSTRFGVGNDLLDSAKSVNRIICPAENAFDKYKNIKKAVLKHVKGLKDPLVLIALGPTATILAYELSSRKIQAIDIGHTDLEYEWYLHKSIKKEHVKGRVVNELGEKPLHLDGIEDTKYNTEIVDEIL